MSNFWELSFNGVTVPVSNGNALIVCTLDQSTGKPIPLAVGGGSVTIDGPLGPQAPADSIPVVPANGIQWVIQPTTGGNIEVETAATGTNYTAFASQACTQLTLVNDSGVDLVWNQGGSGVDITLWAYTTFTIFGISNANQISVKRKDDSNTQVTLQARWES